MNQLWAVVPAAGAGSRLGADVPKQYLSIIGRPLLHWSVTALLRHAAIKGCVVAVPEGDRERARSVLPDDARLTLCTGGIERADSVAAAIDTLADTLNGKEEDWVLVHDAARPCLAMEDLDRLIEVVTGSGVGGLLAEPVSDTLKRVDPHSRVAETVDRSGLWRAQTPQMFRLGELRSALREARLDAGLGADLEANAEISAETSATPSAVTDEASAMERCGHPVQIVAARAYNAKVTYAEDVELAAACLRRREASGSSMMSSAGSQ